MFKAVLFIVVGIAVSGCQSSRISAEQVSQTDAIVTRRVSDRVYQHTSLLRSRDFGVVPCNGMVVISDNEAVIFDSPVDREGAAELIDWVEKDLGCEIKAVVPTHFHADCLGGLAEFHERGIPSYANRLTLEMAAANGSEIPQNGFVNRLELSVGNEHLVAEFLGEGHTRDNIVGYFPRDNVLFGGCLIKEMGAGEGNVAEANVQDWSATARRVKEKYPETEIVIPGHGEVGGVELIDYTIGLFAQE